MGFGSLIFPNKSSKFSSGKVIQKSVAVKFE